MTFRCIIHGPSSLPIERCTEILKHKEDITIVCAAQKSFTPHVTGYCKQQKYKLKVYKPDFQSWGLTTLQMCYKEMADNADAAIIFTDGECKTAWHMEQICKERMLPVRIIRYQTVKQKIEEAEQEPKTKKRKPKVILKLPDWCKQEYIKAHKENQERNTPAAVKDHGYVKTKIPKGTTNGLTDFTCNYFNWKGHHLERISNQGVNRAGKWTKGGGTNGTTDTSGHFINNRHQFSIPIKPEIKTGKDQLSQDQIWFATKMERTGAIHTVITCFEDVFKFYEYLEKL